MTKRPDGQLVKLLGDPIVGQMVRMSCDQVITHLVVLLLCGQGVRWFEDDEPTSGTVSMSLCWGGRRGSG